jgi:hypothetical protein
LPERGSPTNAAAVVGIGLERNGVPSPKFVQRGCTAMANRIQVGEMLLQEGVEAYKKEGPKFMQRLVAKQKAQGQRLMTSSRRGRS